MTHRQWAFVVLVVGMQGQRGAAWQCLTVRRLRAGDQHHEAQLTTEQEGCVCAVCYENAILVILVGLRRLQINHIWCRHGGAELSLCSEKANTPK